MTMPGRNFSSNNYRYGFNGQEKSDELDGDSYTAEFWEYDSRIGRRWNVDPEPRIWESPYLTFGGNPIQNSDVKGNFFIREHIEIEKMAFKIVNGRDMTRKELRAMRKEVLRREVKEAKVTELHLDNIDNNAMSNTLMNGGYEKWDNHQLQDFYSHSNYVEILKENGVAEKDMVTFDKLDKKSDLYKDVMMKIRTETYKQGNTGVDHDGADVGGYKELSKKPELTPMTSDKFMAKDANGSKGFLAKIIGGFKKFLHPLHDTAKRLATDATVNKLSKEKEEKEKTTNTL